MKRSFFAISAIVAMATFVSTDAQACGEAATTAANKTPKAVTVAQLVQMQQANQEIAIFDANNPKTREKYGTIPRAKLLSSFNEYDMAELPKDKAAVLVFYCANTKCTAAPSAAKRAAQAGYKNVYVLEAGIMGWQEAGKQTTPTSV